MTAGRDDEARRCELLNVFRTYDPAAIAAVATVDEIEFAYNAGILGPRVADRAIALRHDSETPEGKVER